MAELHDATPLSAAGLPLPKNWLAIIAFIWTGQAASMITSYAAGYAVVWYVTESTGSALMLAAMNIAVMLPVGLISPFGGIVADKHNRKLIMIAADGAVGVISLVAGVFILAGDGSIPLLLAVCIARAVGQAFHSPAMMAAMPMLVPDKHLLRINTLDQSLTSASAIVGPVLGIALYTMLGFVAVLVMDAICAALACVCLAFAKLPYAQGHGVSSGSVAKDLAHGLSILRGEPGIKPLLLLVVVAMLLFLPLGTLSPLMTYNWFGGDGYAASGVEAAAGIGLLIGSLFMLVWGGGKRLVPVLVVAGAAIGAGCIAAGLLPQSGFFAFVGIIALIFAATAVFNAPILPLMQKRIPQESFGRAMGIFGSLTALASPVGLFVAGPAADALGVNCWFVVCGALLCIAMGLSLLSRSLRALDDQDVNDPADALESEACE